MATIKDVAERAGVSTATVSRALSGSSAVKSESLNRILLAVAELGYRPNRLASNLRRQTSEMVGVVVSDIENPHFTQVVRAVEDAAYQRGYRVLLCNTDEKPEKQRSYLEVLAAERVVGVIISPSDPTGAEISELLSSGIPVVAFDRRVEDARADAVVIDNARGARLATEYLVGLGHDRIGFVAGLPKIQTGRERLAGYEEAMRIRGLPVTSASGEFRIGQAVEATRELLASGELTALLVANNLMTIGALRAIRAHGLRVPQDIAIVSIDDPPWAELVEPPLTTLAQPVRLMAECAVNLIFERISGERIKPKTEIFNFELKVRQSCGGQSILADGRAMAGSESTVNERI